MNLLDDKTVESMLADVRQIECGLGYGRELDLCCHIKALAADREELKGMIEAQCSEIAWLMKEIDCTIEILIPTEFRVRVYEVGEPKSLCKSLAISVAKMALALDARTMQVRGVADVCEENAGELRRELAKANLRIKELIKFIRDDCGVSIAE